MKNDLIDLDWLRSMQAALGDDALRSILNDVAEQFAEQRDSIREAVADGRFSDAARSAHLLKGAFLQAGFPALGDFSIQLEDQLQREDVAAAESALEALTNAYHEAAQGLQTFWDPPTDETL